MQCDRCKQTGLAADFPSCLLTSSCNHPSPLCIQCAANAQVPFCPLCGGRIEASLKESFQQQLEDASLWVQTAKRMQAQGNSNDVIFVSNMMGHVIQVPLPQGPNTSIREIKEFIEAQTKVNRRQQRLLFGVDELKAFDHNTKAPKFVRDFVGLEGGATIHMLSAYTEFAGQVGLVEGAQVDRYGNSQGSKFDLGVDGAFEGLRICVLHLYTGEGFDFRFPEAAMKKKGFSVLRWTTPPAPGVLKAELAKACQLWVISNTSKLLSNEHLSEIQRFFDSGRGVYVWGDNDPFYADANFVGAALFGATMQGNTIGNKCVQLQTNPRAGHPGFTKHPIMTSIANIYEGITIATIQNNNNNLTPVIYGSAGNLVTAAYEKNGRRGLLDGGFTRLYCNWDTAGTERYVINAAVWLVNLENDW